MALPRIEDRWLWIGLGVLGFIAVKGIAYTLQTIRQLNELPIDAAPTDVLTAETEDGTVSISTNLHSIPIKLESLQALATSPNYDIRKAATKILITRFLANGSARKLLHRELESPDADVRESARRALLLIERHQFYEPEFQRYRRYPHGHAPPRRSRPLAEESPEEQEVRRRRREAMVLNEGDRPVSQDDIIEVARDRDNENNNWEPVSPGAVRTDSPRRMPTPTPPNAHHSAPNPNLPVPPNMNLEDGSAQRYAAAVTGMRETDEEVGVLARLFMMNDGVIDDEEMRVSMVLTAWRAMRRTPDPMSVEEFAYSYLRATMVPS